MSNLVPVVSPCGGLGRLSGSGQIRGEKCGQGEARGRGCRECGPFVKGRMDGNVELALEFRVRGGESRCYYLLGGFRIWHFCFGSSSRAIDCTAEE